MSLSSSHTLSLGAKTGCWFTSTVVVYCILVFHFGESCLCLLESLRHLIHELIDRLKFQLYLLRLESYIRVSTSIDHKGGVLH
jgi:hypothetical protein